MRRSTTKKIALVTRLVSEAQSISVRKNGRCQMNRKPSASWRRIGSRARRGAVRSVRTRLTVAHATAKVIASTANGSHRVTAYNAPPSGPPSSEATCWRAWFWLRAVGRSSVATTDRIAESCAGLNAPAATPATSATPTRWGSVRLPVAPATASEVYAAQPVALDTSMIRLRSTRSASTPAGSSVAHRPPR